jgi:hypothetical protein
VSGAGFCSDYIANGKGHPFCVLVIVLTAVLKTDLNDIKRAYLCWQGHIAQPVKDREFVAAICAASTIIFTALGQAIRSGGT